MTTTRAYIFDMDGVLFRGNDPIDGAAETLTRLRALDPTPQLFFLTNNSWQARSDYAEKLGRMGMPCDENEIVTSASATAVYLREQGAAGKQALVVGGQGIIDELSAVGIEVVSSDSPFEVPVDYVVVGIDREFTYQRLWRAQYAIRRGAAFIATNRDTTYPIEGGEEQPGGGAIVAAIAACTNTEPVTIGKPETHGLQAILTMAKVAPEEAVMIGDRLDTDVLCANRLGVPTVLVLTGVTPEEAVAQASDEMRPTHVLPDLRAL